MVVVRKAFTIDPDPQQQQAIERVSGPMLVVAGAGTGKTTVLIQRIARLVREGHTRPDEIVALTYTDNAAREMQERIAAELGGETKGLQICTFHAYCNGLLSAAGRNFNVLDDKQLWIFLRRNLAQMRLNYFVRAANVTKFLDDLLDFVRRCHDELVTPEDYRNYVTRLERGELPIPRVTKSKEKDQISDEEALGRCCEIAFVFETIERMLRDRNLGTFGHMIVRANDLLAEDAEVLAKVRARSRFVLVDEFQDANFAQIDMLGKLAGATPPEQNIFAVGDPDQGIYRFRGASSDAFDLFLRRFPDAKVVRLTRNRRSTTPILKCAYALIAENPEVTSQSGASYCRQPLVSARDEQDPEQAVKRASVEAVLVTSPFMEAADLVSVLQERRRRSRCQWKDLAILYRSHVHRDEAAAELARNNIPFSIEGLDVLDTPEVRDLLACLGAVVSPNDSAPLLRVAALRQFEIDPDSLRNAMKSVPRDSDSGIASILPGVPGGARILATLERARELAPRKKAVDVLGALLSIFELPRTGATTTFLDFARKWEESPLTETGGAPEFLEYLELFREARGAVPLPASEEDDTVKLMTAHAAKGLEFEHVFVLRSKSNSFPAAYRESLIDLPRELRKSNFSSPYDDKTLNSYEERRLFYVAMTRARDTLSIYGPFGTGKNEKTPPGYLRELLKNSALRSFLKQRRCREFQTTIFAGEEPAPQLSRLFEWIALPPSSDLASSLSATALESYKQCPLRFKLEREWRIPGDLSAALQYGASIHRVLRTYYDSVRLGRPKSEEELLQQFRDDLASEAIADRYQHDLYEKQGIAQLREFLAGAQQNAADVLHTEEYFNIKIGETSLMGRIDRVDRAGDGRVVIVDYKTGKPKSQEDADDSLQLSLYALAARETWGYTPERLAFHNLDGNTLISTTRSGIQLEEARLEVEKIAAKIAQGTFDPTPGYHCNFCAYRGLCPKTEKCLPEMAAVPSIATP